MAKTSEPRRRKQTYLALLRGINVGGRNKLPMEVLTALFSAAGCEHVQTYIQSGNVLFEASKPLARELPRQIETTIAEQLELSVPLVMLDAGQITSIAHGNPYLDKEDIDPKQLHVVFLAEQPNAEQLAALNPDRSPPDSFVAHGRAIYLHCPNGVARTKLSNKYFDRVLDTTSTIRNWRTVLKLAELAQQLPKSH